MGDFQPLMKLTVLHDYYTSGTISALRYELTPHTERLVNNAGLVVRANESGFYVFHNVEKSEAIRQINTDKPGHDRIEFKVFVEDPHFKNFTDIPVNTTNSMLYFSNDRFSRKQKKFTLNVKNYVGVGDVKNIDDSQFVALLNPKDRVIKPTFTVSLALYPMKLSKVMAFTFRDYVIRFKARETFWKYYLLGDIVRGSLSIADPSQCVFFNELGETIIGDGKYAKAYLSKKPHMLKERQEYKLQLREKGQNGRVLIKRLPVATARQVNRDVINGKQAYISEVYVNC